MKTAMTIAVQEFDNQDPNKQYTAQEVTNILVELLEQERKQIQSAYRDGYEDGGYAGVPDGEEYFKNTFTNP